MIKHVISYIKHTYVDIFIILYIDEKVHHWHKIAQNRTKSRKITQNHTKSQKKKKKITRFESSDVKHTFLYIRLNRYDDCFLLKNIILIILYIDGKVHYRRVRLQKKNH